VAGTIYSWSALRAPRVAVARRPLVSILAGAALAVLIFSIVSFVNVGLVRADIIYKQGQQFDGQANWVQSAELYRRALDARRTEDHYMLFLGRALLEQAKATQILDDASGFPQQATLDDVLALDATKINQMGRFELLRAAEAVLKEAQDVNPLNTDHTANLARLYRTWADQAAALGDAGATMRQEKLDQSIAEYNMAVTLSPQAAHLWNEKGNAHLARGERDLAEQAYLQSLSLDPYYEQTYLLLADFYENDQRFADSAELLRDGIARLEERRGPASTLQLKSYLGVALSRLGDYDGAIQAMQEILAVQPSNQAALRNLVLLYRDAGRMQEAAQAAEDALAALPAEQSAERAQLQAVALEIYQQLASENPDDYRYPLVIAQLLQEQGQFDAARPFAQQALQLAPAEQQPAVQQFLAGLGG
jgi:tetratricopeptide (TPR) repeat protein